MRATVRSLKLFGVVAPLPHWAWLGASILVSIVAATQVPVEVAKRAVQSGGYWFLWAMVLGASYFGVRVMRSRVRVVRRWFLGAPTFRRWMPLVLVLAASAFLHLHFPHRFKVLMDEVTLVNTSQALHQHRKVFTPVNAQYHNGLFLVDEGFIDKRPCLYPFITSLVHDVTGYRATNGIWLNAALTPCIVLLFFVIGRRLWRRFGGITAVLLAIGVPIFGHTFTGGGFEPLNLLLLLLLTYAGMLCVERPDADRASWVVLTACLLAYTRYESGLYVVAAIGILVLAFRSGRFGSFPAAVYVAPLLCAPLVWMQLVAFSDEKNYFQLAAKNDPSAFSAGYLRENLHSALDFFIMPSAVNLSSPLIAVGGLLAMIVLGWTSIARFRARCRPQTGPAMIVALITAVTLANAAIFLFFNYGQYSSYITQRISVPIWAAFIVVIAWWCGRSRRRVVFRITSSLGLANLFLFYLPAANGDFYTRQYLEGKDCEFVLDFNDALGPEEGIFVYSFSPAAWLAVQRPTMSFRFAPKDVSEVRDLVLSGRYHRVLVHVMEYAEGVPIEVGERHRPPAWFAGTSKRVVGERWVYSRIIDRVYELSLESDATEGPNPGS